MPGRQASGERGDAGVGAAVERLGRAEQAADDGGKRGGGFRAREERVGRDAGAAHPGEREIEAAGAGVFADVAGDVGELHGNTEVAGAGKRGRVADAH